MNLPNYKKPYVTSVIHKQAMNQKCIVFLAIVYKLFCAKIKRSIFEHLWQFFWAINFQKWVSMKVFTVIFVSKN